MTKLWDKNPPAMILKPARDKDTAAKEKWYQRKLLQSSVVQCKVCEGWMYYSQEFCSWCDTFK